MKKLTLFLAVFALCFITNAQVTTPQASPSAELEFKVGLTDIEIEYSRPNASGRTIFGDLVPFGKIWRTGANKNTTISFSDDVIIDGQTLKAGKYAIFTKPEKSSWEVYFYSDNENWGVPQKWDESKIAAKTTVQALQLPMNIETFAISIDDLTYDSAKLNFLWEKTYVEVKINVPTDKKVMNSIENAKSAGFTSQDYLAAANYYYTNGKDIKQAKKWIDEGMKLNKDPKFYQFRQQALIYAKSGDKKGAIRLAKQSLEGAKKAGNNDYIKMNEASLKEWGAK
ncbi:MAG: DUF2911 domain-containing protein [Moheibacter sp.]